MSSIFNKLNTILNPKKEEKKGNGLILFKNVKEAISAERILKNYSVKKIRINNIIYSVFKIKDGRSYADQVSNVAYIKNNYI